MNDPFTELRDRFLAALECDGPDAQLRYADENCPPSSELHDKLIEMLKVHHQADGFLASQPGETPALHAELQSLGSQLGPYKLLQQIGEGGMGTVYMAEQTQPVQRKVAIK